MSSPLTLDKLKDKRFYETEKAIFYSVSREGVGEIEEVIVAAKISRATFYRHHRAWYLIENDYEELVEMWVRGLVEGMGTSGDKIRVLKSDDNNMRTLRKMYFEMLLFIFKHRALFLYFLARENMRVYAKMMREVKPIVIQTWWPTKWMESVYEIYAGEVIGMIVRWGSDGFLEEEIMRTLENIISATKDAKKRLEKFRKQ